MEVSRFTDRLNKVNGKVYVIEELIYFEDGLYESELQHDNINMESLSIYTGSKLTGNKIETYTLSTPSLTPWKKIIKIYSSEEMAYITYETTGDTVEADDINQLQDSIIDTQTEINAESNRAKTAEMKLSNDLQKEVGRATAGEKAVDDDLKSEVSRAKAMEVELQGNIHSHTTAVNGEIQSLKAKDLDLDNKKASIVYVNGELNKRYTKEETYTKAEILKKIEDLIGSAPETLDTFKEIANALGNDPNFSSTIMASLALKVDKVNGKQLTSNDYSDIEKNTVADVNARKHDHNNKNILDQLSQVQLNNWGESYTHITDSHKHITDTERNHFNDSYEKRHEHANSALLSGITQSTLAKWDNVTNKVDKIPGKALSANDYTAADKGKLEKIEEEANHYVHPDKHLSSIITQDSSNRFVTDVMINKLGGIEAKAQVNVQSDWNVENPEADSFIKNKPKSLPAADVSPWAKANTKPVYGWDEITGKPISYKPITHNHTKIQITDMPTDLSEFSNDSGFLRESDLDGSLNHTHGNKDLLDTIKESLLNNWNKASEHVNSRSNPHATTAEQIGAAKVLHAHTNLEVNSLKKHATDLPSTWPEGIYTTAISNQSYPCTYGNLLTIKQGETVNQLCMELSLQDGGIGGMWIRNKREAGADIFSPFRAFSFNDHNHDSIYLKKGGLTWNDLKGV